MTSTGRETIKRIALLLLFLVGCGGGGGDGSGPDPASEKHVLYLNFEGQVLTTGADDPALNHSALVSGTTTFPAYLAGDAARTSKINALVSEVQTILAPYDIAVVTTRPSNGSYDMLVAGGQATLVGRPSGAFGQAPVDCTAPTPLPSHVSLMFDAATGHDAARQIVASLGISHSIPNSTSNSDCMCIGSGCPTGLTAACTIGAANTPVDAAATCRTAATMDENQAFLTLFGAHP